MRTQSFLSEAALISIRPATEEDDRAVTGVVASAISTLRETYRPTRDAPISDVHILTKLNRLVALLDSKVVGTTRYWIDGDSLRIVGLSVHSQFRNRGVATELIRYLADIGDSLGARRMVLHTVKETGNVPIFQKLGFKIVVETDDTSIESAKFLKLTDVEMQRPLTAFGAQATECSR